MQVVTRGREGEGQRERELHAPTATRTIFTLYISCAKQTQDVPKFFYGSNMGPHRAGGGGGAAGDDTALYDTLAFSLPAY